MFLCSLWRLSLENYNLDYLGYIYIFFKYRISIPDTLNFSEKLESKWTFWLFYGLTKKRQDTWKAGASFCWSLNKLPAAVLYITPALWMSLFLLDTYLAQIQKVAWEMVFTTDLAVLKEAGYSTWISYLKYQMVVKSSMGTKRISTPLEQACLWILLLLCSDINGVLSWISIWFSIL